jgi:ZIP family zinc transporter
VSAVAAGLGYLLVAGAPAEVVGGIRGFAAGAVLTMVASTMLPEAHDEGGPVTALVTTAGFVVAVAIGGVPG